VESGRELFELFLKRKPLSRPAFVPLVRGLAARVGGASVEALTADPTIWANSLVKTAELFDLDGIVAGFDPSLMAEACGCKVKWEADRPVLLPPSDGLCANPETSGRMRHAIEAAGRIFQVCRNERACVAALTGPLTLTRNLFGDVEDPAGIRAVKTFLVRAAEAFCAVRPDVLIFMEGGWPGGDLDPKYKRVYQTLRNITSHYGVNSGLYVQGHGPANMADLSGLEMDVYILGPSDEGRPPAMGDLWKLGSGALGVGLGLPFDDLDLAQRIIDEGLDYYRSRGRVGFFYTSFGPVTRNTDPETLHHLVGRIRQARI
jgi:hypothetical protein